jgi:hypothetical protein
MEISLFSGYFKIAIRRLANPPKTSAGPSAAFCVEFTDVHHPMFVGHPWPFRGLTQDIDEFFWGDV